MWLKSPEGTSSSLAFFENQTQGPGWSPTSKRQEGDNVVNLRESVESPPGWRCCSVVGSWQQGSPWWTPAGSQPENRKTRMCKDWRVSMCQPDTVNVPQTRWIYFTSPSGKQPSESICKGEELSTRRQWQIFCLSHSKQASQTSSLGVKPVSNSARPPLDN